MNPIPSTLVHKILPARQLSGDRSPAIILLHGRGSNEDDLLGLAEFLDARCILVAARAPFDFQPSGGFTWYDLLEVGRPDPKMFAESYRRLTQFIEDVKKGYPIDPSRVFFLGFSMGTIMSYAMALTNHGEVAGVVANSGYIPEDAELNFEWDQLGEHRSSSRMASLTRSFPFRWPGEHGTSWKKQERALSTASIQWHMKSAKTAYMTCQNGSPAGSTSHEMNESHYNAHNLQFSQFEIGNSTFAILPNGYTTGFCLLSLGFWIPS